MKKFLTTAIATMAVVAVPTAVSAQEPIVITLVQGVPTPPNVDIIVDGTNPAGSTNIAAGAIVNVTDYAGTQPTLQVVETGTTNSLMAPETVSVPATGNNSVVLTMAGAMIFANKTAQVPNGEARLTVRNASTDVTSINLVGASEPINGVGVGAEGELEQPAGALNSAQIVSAGGGALAAVPPTNLAAGTNTILYLFGDANRGYRVTTQVIEVRQSAAETTTTTIAGQSTTTSTTLPATSTTATSVPSAVNTGSPVDDSNTMVWVLIVVGGLAVAGGAYLVRRRV